MMLSMMMPQMMAQKSQMNGMFQTQFNNNADSSEYDYDYTDAQDTASPSLPLAALVQSLLAARLPQPEAPQPHVEIAFKGPATVPASAPVEISPDTRSSDKQEPGPRDQISYRSAP